MMDGDVFVWIFIIEFISLVLLKSRVFFLGYNFDKPDSFSDEKLKRQMQFHIAARQGPMSGLSSQWDYETGLFLYFQFISIYFDFSRYLEKINKTTFQLFAFLFSYLK